MPQRDVAVACSIKGRVHTAGKVDTICSNTLFHTSKKACCGGMANAGVAVQRKHSMIVKYSDRPNC